jgi:acetyltransferase
VLADHDVPVAPSRLAESPDAAVEAAAEFGGAVALKVVSPDIQHKTEAGGIALDVAGEAAVRSAYERVVASVTESRPEAAIEGVLVSPMVEGGIEVIVGALEDPEVGPVVMFGLGGVFVEVLDDVAFAAVPLTEYDARQLIDGIDGAALLRGARGRPPIDEDALVAVLLGVSRVMEANPTVTEIDLNPVICDGDGATVVDASIHL